jgi:Mn2+/Fe2+ NRAMP family transporter
MDILKYVTEQALILIPVLYIIGMMLKSSNVKDNYIPWILLVIGIIGAVAISGLSVQAVIQGVLVAGVTVFTNQLVKQAGKEE